MTLAPAASAAISLKTVYGITIVSFVVIGIQLFMCLYGFTVFLESTPTTRKGLRGYILVSFLILALFIVSQISDGYEIFTVLFDSSNAIEAIQLRQKEDHTWWAISSASTIVSLSWIGDGLLLYRSWIIWADKRWVLGPVAAVYLSSIAFSICSIVSEATYSNPSARFNSRTLSAWIFLSVSVNCLVTGLISYRLLQVRREVREVMPKRDVDMYYGVIAILVESALPLSLAGIIYAAAVSSPPTVPARIISGLSNILWFSFNALAPQMIIFRVVMGRSWMNKRRDNHVESLDPVFNNDTSVSNPEVIVMECKADPPTSEDKRVGKA